MTYKKLACLLQLAKEEYEEEKISTNQYSALIQKAKTELLKIDRSKIGKQRSRDLALCLVD